MLMYSVKKYNFLSRNDHVNQTNLNTISSSHIKIAICDLNGVLRSKYIAKEKYDKALKEGMGFCDVILGSDIDDQLIDNLSFTGWQSGYPDAKINLIKNTMRQIPYENNRALVLAQFAQNNNQLCPRSILNSIIDKAKQAGFQATVGMEFEFTLFEETADSLHQKQFHNLKTISPGNFGYSLLRSAQFSEFYEELLTVCDQMQIPIEGLHTEIGPGVLEAALQQAPILEAADRAILFKSVVKTLAQKRGWTACFMAKWTVLNQGQSGHIHLSLADLDGQSVFYDEKNDNNISKTMLNFIGGQQLAMPDFLALSAPFINSYARLVPGHWAPTKATWGIDNRTCAIRVIEGNPKSQRIEYRIPGADANPYLAMSAALASGLWGIEQKIKPSAAITGNAYESSCANIPSLATNILDSAQAFRNSEIAPLFFSDIFINDYSTTREWEYKQYQSSITDWQLNRYFELA